MRSRRRGKVRSDSEILAHRGDMALLRAVAAGRVVRGASGHDASFNAPYLLEGEPVQLVLRWLAGEGLVRLPLSGPPVLGERGGRFVAGEDGIE
jgi:hypothetical protein